MKAKDWILCYKNLEDFWDHYGKETRELVLERTKNSNSNTILAVANSAIKEQKEKLTAIGKKIPEIRVEYFDKILPKILPEYQEWNKIHKSIEIDSDVVWYRKTRNN